MTILQKFVSNGLPNHPNCNMTSISFITIHTTGNRNIGATAEAHARLQARGNDGRLASWHYTVDKDEIWQSFGDKQMCWHTGTRLGNENSIGIEICVNKRDGFRQACERAAWLCAYLLGKHCLRTSDLRQHHDWSGKNCPRELRSGEWAISWQDFLDMVEKSLMDCSDKDEIPILIALRDAGIRFDANHWREVFKGSILPNQAWTKMLIARVIEQRWRHLSADAIGKAIMELIR